MAKISTGQSFNAGDQLTSTKLNNIVGSAFLDSDSITGTTLNLNNGQLKVATNGISSNEVADNQVTFAKIQDISNAKVIGRTSAGTGDPEEVSILDEDAMTSDSATALATQQSIKAYVDSKLVSDEYVSAQGTGTTTATTTTTDEIVGSVSLTLPSGKTWKWVKLVFSTELSSQDGIEQVKVRETGGSFLSWVSSFNGRTLTTTNSDDKSHPTFIFEGVPSTTGSNITIEVTGRKVSTHGVDVVASRELYAVGIASS